MSRSVLKKMCEGCKRLFFTYEKEKNFCNSECEGHTKYCSHFRIRNKRVENLKEYKCKACGDKILSSMPKYICNIQCEKLFNKMQKDIESLHKIKKKQGPKKSMPYEILNKLAEKKRVFDDPKWLYKTNREKI